MERYNTGLNNYLRAVVDAEALAIKPQAITLLNRERYLKDLVSGRIALFIDNVNLRIGICDVVTTCGIKKTQPIEMLKLLPDFNRGYGALLQVLRPINKALLKKYWAMDDNLIEAVSAGKITLSDIDRIPTVA